MYELISYNIRTTTLVGANRLLFHDLEDDFGDLLGHKGDEVNVVVHQFAFLGAESLRTWFLRLLVPVR